MSWFRRKRTIHADLAPHDSASRISAYVYGNVLILAALVALSPSDLTSGKAAVIVLGTGITTYLAHLLAESVGHRPHRVGRPGRAVVLAELRNAMPIVSSTAAPALFLAAAWLGWITPVVALSGAVLVTVGRMAFLGGVLARLRGQKSSLLTIFAGVGLAVLCAAIAAVKMLLTH